MSDKTIRKDGDLQVYWFPQVPMDTPFIVDVHDIFEAKLLLDVLANYDLYQLEQNIKPDYSNAGGLRVWDSNSDGEGTPDWVEWYDEEGDELDEHFRKTVEENYKDVWDEKC